MVIVRLQGGLGNQLFQYALYRSLLVAGKNVKLDSSVYYSGKEERTLELPKLGLCFDIASREELHKFYADDSRLSDRIMRYTFGKEKYYKEKYSRKKLDISNTDNVYLSGYWQERSYFEKVIDDVRKSCYFQDQDLWEKSEIAQNMLHSNSVSVHVRRGDYLQNQQVYDVCTLEYYKSAYAYMKSMEEDLTFFVFSDDPEYIYTHFERDDTVIVNSEEADSTCRDLYLMSCCRHHIIANSSFSWWGAWLGDRADSIIIAPAEWTRGNSSKEVILPHWNTIGV